MNARPLTAALLRRLGEAADGYRTGRPVYVVACYDDPRDALRVFEREADALEHLARAGDRFGMFGPFATPVDGSASGVPVGEAGASLEARDGSAPAGEVVEVVLSLRDDAGAETTIRLDGREHDALFWSMSAIDKFAVPYYTRTDGPEYAAEMRRRAMRAQGTAVAHMPRSEYISQEPGLDGDDAAAASLRVDSVTLTIREGDRTREVRLDGREHDSVFWSLSAIDKFAVPYYARTDGPEYAAEMRRRAMSGPVCGLAHLPSSDYIGIGDDEELDGHGAPAASLCVETVTLTIREGDGTREVRLDGREHDALFWSLSAVDKFAVPYYARTDGPEYAAEMRRGAMAGPVCGLAHLPSSDYVGIGDDEELGGHGAPAASLCVEAVTLTIREGDGTREVRLDGREHDSVFWSLSAIDKFAVPYYARTDGAEYAARLRREVLASPVHALVHLPDTMSLTLDAAAARAEAAAEAWWPEKIAA